MIKVWHLNERKLLGDFTSWDEADSRYLDAKMGMRSDGSQEKAVLSLKNDGFYELAAVVDTNDLEVAWDQTNHIDDSWTNNKGVSAKMQNPRSSSTGDVFEVETGALFVCAPIGFRELKQEPAQTAKPKI